MVCSLCWGSQGDKATGPTLLVNALCGTMKLCGKQKAKLNARLRAEEECCKREFKTSRYSHWSRSLASRARGACKPEPSGMQIKQLSKSRSRTKIRKTASLLRVEVSGCRDVRATKRRSCMQPSCVQIDGPAAQAGFSSHWVVRLHRVGGGGGGSSAVNGDHQDSHSRLARWTTNSLAAFPPLTLETAAGSPNF